MTLRAPFILTCVATALAGCDMATEMATDAVSAEVRTRYIAQCEEMAANMSIPAAMVTEGCECSADKLAEELETGELQVDQAKIEDIVKTCVQENGSNAVADLAETN